VKLIKSFKGKAAIIPSKRSVFYTCVPESEIESVGRFGLRAGVNTDVVWATPSRKLSYRIGHRLARAKGVYDRPIVVQVDVEPQRLQESDGMMMFRRVGRKCYYVCPRHHRSGDLSCGRLPRSVLSWDRPDDAVTDTEYIERLRRLGSIDARIAGSLKRLIASKTDGFKIGDVAVGDVDVGKALVKVEGVPHAEGRTLRKIPRKEWLKKTKSKHVALGKAYDYKYRNKTTTATVMDRDGQNVFVFVKGVKLPLSRTTLLELGHTPNVGDVVASNNDRILVTRVSTKYYVRALQHGNGKATGRVESLDSLSKREDVPDSWIVNLKKPRKTPERKGFDIKSAADLLKMMKPMSKEEIDSVFRRMSDQDWSRVKTSLGKSFKAFEAYVATDFMSRNQLQYGWIPPRSGKVDLENKWEDLQAAIKSELKGVTDPEDALIMLYRIGVNKGLWRMGDFYSGADEKNMVEVNHVLTIQKPSSERYL